MTLFRDFSRPPTPQQDGSLADWQRRLDALFPSAVSKSPLRLWAPGDPIAAKGGRLLIGVATWSAHDMALLDAVSQVVQASKPGLVVEVFNVADCPSPDAFERYVPGLDKVFHTPVAGLWSDGRLVEMASGFAARQLVARISGLEVTGGERRG